eukprot:Clim_evm43s109 gene=Clim_evmTU43s109
MLGLRIHPRLAVPRRSYVTDSVVRSELLERLNRHPKDATALIQHSNGKSFTYNQIRWGIMQTGSRINNLLPIGYNEPQRIGIWLPRTPSFAVAAMGILSAGHTFVPMAVEHPVKELAYTLQNSGSSAMICHPDWMDTGRLVMEELNNDGTSLIPMDSLWDLNNCTNPKDLVEVSTGNPAAPSHFIYTSGTTGRPKGVVLSHLNLNAMLSQMAEAWAWTAADRALLVLPLHHVHGLANVLLSGLYSGGTVEMMDEGFHVGPVWHALTRDPRDPAAITFFSAVPTVYDRLLAKLNKLKHEHNDDDVKVATELTSGACSSMAEVRNRLSAIRLMICGSAALPEPLLQRWQEVSGHTLLERYGMSEIGMGLTNPYKPMEDRRPGWVGKVFPGVETRVVPLNDDEEHSDANASEEYGELHIRGPNVFEGYWELPEETAANFTDDGWFKTGDTAAKTTDGWHRILGRTSVDILKSGGYKISALEIERELLSLDGVEECAVVGVPDEALGERIIALLVQSKVKTSSNDEIRKELSKELAPYKIPRELLVVESLPRNAMGKINKKSLVKEFQAGNIKGK